MENIIYILVAVAGVGIIPLYMWNEKKRKESHLRKQARADLRDNIIYADEQRKEARKILGEDHN